MDIITGIFSAIAVIVISIAQWVTYGLDDYFFQPKIEEPISIIIPKDAYLSSNHNYEHSNELYISSTMYCKKTDTYLRKGDIALITSVVQDSRMWSDTNYRYTVMVNNVSYDIITTPNADDDDKPIYAPLLRHMNMSSCPDVEQIIKDK
jgi:hypothetical protein